MATITRWENKEWSNMHPTTQEVLIRIYKQIMRNADMVKKEVTPGYCAASSVLSRCITASCSWLPETEYIIHVDGTTIEDICMIERTASEYEELKKINENDPWICNISASLGVYAAVPQAEDNIDIFMTMADRSMYADKNKRKYGRRKDDIKTDPQQKETAET